MRNYRTKFLLPQLMVVLTLACPHRVAAQAGSKATPDSVAIITTLERFHALLARGDTLNAVKLLAPDLTVLESGDIESRSEYLAHHLQADVEFERGVPGTRRVRSVQQLGDVAWISSESISHGMFRGSPIHSRGAELVVLARERGDWRIRAIHWSSRRIAAP